LDEDVHRIKNRYKLFLNTASKVLTQWLTWCGLSQNICWDYFAFCGTWLVEVVMSCCKQNIQCYIFGLVC